jgi:hypothetical protein
MISTLSQIGLNAHNGAVSVYRIVWVYFKCDINNVYIKIKLIINEKFMNLKWYFINYLFGSKNSSIFIF